MARGRGGFIGQDGLNAPDSPTGVSASAGDAQATVSFTAPTDVGGSAITGYNVQSNNGDGSISSIANASYDSKSFDVSEDDLTSNLTFKPDGTKMYVVGRTNDKVYQYALSTAFDVSTASYESKSFSFASQEIQPYGIALNNNGTGMYTVGFDTDTVYQYTLSTPYDVSTASYSSNSLSVGSQDTVPTANTFNADGTSLYVMGSTNNEIFQYTLSSAFDVSTGSYASKSLDFSSQDTNASGFQFNADGTKCFIVGNSSDKVHQYSLSTAYDISTASSDGVSFDLSSQDANPFGLAFSTDRTKMYVLGSDDYVYQYTTNLTSYASASPITVTGLSNGTSYTFNVWAINAFGFSAPSDASGSVSPALARGLFFAGYQSTISTKIEYIDLTTSGNTTDFGDMLTTVRLSAAGFGSTTRGGIGGGYTSASANTNVVQYVTFSTLGDASDFGDLTVARSYMGGTSNNTRGIFGPGWIGSSTDGNVIDYITIASTGNATDFGDVTVAKSGPSALASPTRAVLNGGYSFGSTTYYDVMEYITIGSTGNATDFGDLVTPIWYTDSAASSTRGLIMGGDNHTQSPRYKDTIQYITIASTGNATDFGDLTSGKALGAATSSNTIAVFGGGVGTSGYVNNIDQVTIASTGNATDFGDLSTAHGQFAASSNCHGGVQ